MAELEAKKGGGAAKKKAAGAVDPQKAAARIAMPKVKKADKLARRPPSPA